MIMILIRLFQHFVTQAVSVERNISGHIMNTNPP